MASTRTIISSCSAGTLYSALSSLPRSSVLSKSICPSARCSTIQPLPPSPRKLTAFALSAKRSTPRSQQPSIMGTATTSGPQHTEPSSALPSEPPLSLYRLLEPQVLADPYPLYERLRREDPVHWDPYLHAWVVTRYADVLTVFQRFSAQRTPTPEQLTTLGLASLAPLAQVMVRQMLFLDPPAHARVRGLASQAFTPRRVERLRSHIQDITHSLLDAVQDKGQMEMIADLARPLPAIVTAELLGVPISDWRQLTAWS